MMNPGDTDVFERGSRQEADASATIAARNKVREKGMPIGNEAVYAGSSTVVAGSYVDVGALGITAANAYMIYGNIKDDLGANLSGVAVAISGDYSGSDTTDANGDFVVYFLYNGDYTVTPSKDGYFFTPTNETISSANVEKDYVGTRVAVSGTVSVDTGGFLESATMSLTDESDESTAADGTFTFALVEDGDKTLTPTKASYEFDPVNSEFTVSRESISGKDFEATRTGYLFSNRRAIVIDNTYVDAGLTDFPSYVTVTDLDKAKLRADGQDVVFYASDDSTRLSIEIEDYDDSGATGVLCAWTKIPTVADGAPTTIYMYYNSSDFTQPAADSAYGSESVWDAGYIGVFHMDDEPDASHITGSTGNSWTGTKNSSASGPTECVGVTHKGQVFASANNDRILFTHNAGYMSASKTISLWCKRSSTDPMIDKGYQDGFILYNGGAITFWGKDTEGTVVRMTGDTTTNAGTWYHVAAVYGYSGGVVNNLYINSALETLVFETVGNGYLAVDNTDQLIFGARGVADYFLGSLDEIRISSVIRSQAWLKAEYYSQGLPATWCAVGAETSDTKVVPT